MAARSSFPSSLARSPDPPALRQARRTTALPQSLSLTLRRIGPHDAGEAHAVLVACGRDLAARGFRNWDPPYPLERMRADAASDELYAVRAPDDSTVATFALSIHPPHPADPPPWHTPDDAACYLSRLAVLPSVQGSGVGAWCLERVEERATALGRRAVRFDVYAPNDSARAFYERHGYALRGLRSRKGMEYACYEKDVLRVACGGA